MAERKRITIAILALGGQGGGVLADWILALGRANGYWVQGTSVPGVAQRTGSTVYYVELFPEEVGGSQPVLALVPVPGDVDVVLASELMEAGRAIVRGFVSSDRTTLIASTHRVYTITEKSAMGNGLANGERVLQAAGLRAKRFIGFDMEDSATRSGSLISSVMFGVLSASGTLPFSTEDFEEAIRAGGIAIEANLRGFQAGRDDALRAPTPAPEKAAAPQPTTQAGRRIMRRIEAELPNAAHPFAIEGSKRLMDYQDTAYAHLYLDRLKAIAAVGDSDLVAEVARYLALWMSYEDTIRVADLKIRGARIDRVRDEVKVGADQILDVTEYLHPRLQEVCDTLPAWLGRAVLGSKSLSRFLEPLFRKGRHVRTTSLGWFLAMRALAGLRRWRRTTLRYHEEQALITSWLRLVEEVAPRDRHVAMEIVKCQRLIKGYGDTHVRGLHAFNEIVSAYSRLVGRPDTASILGRLREQALADDTGVALKAALAKLDDPPERSHPSLQRAALGITA